MLISEEQQKVVLEILEVECPVRPPGPFNFMPKDWVKWKRRFIRYLSANDAAVFVEQETQINLLLHLLGPKAEDLFLQLETLEEDRENLRVAGFLEQLDRHFDLLNQRLYTRVLFHRRVQRQHECVNEFIRAVHLLAEACDFGEVKDEMIRDKVVVGIRDEAARQRLFLRDNLTLQQAISAAHNAEVRQIRQHG